MCNCAAPTTANNASCSRKNIICNNHKRLKLKTILEK
jgi:hypothetical protein